jgi:hypothetical protein
MTQRPFSSQPDQSDDLDDDAFDDVLSASLRGDRRRLHDIDAGMAATIDQLVGWAELSGFANEPATRAVFEATPARPSRPSSDSRRRPEPLPRPNVPSESVTYRTASSGTRRRYSIMGFFSGLAVAALLVASIFTARPFFDRHDPSPTQLAFQGLPGSPATQYAAGTSPTPDASATQTQIGVPGVDARGVDPLTPDECTVAPASRQHIVSVLGTPPGDYADIVNPKQMHATTYADIPADDLNQVFREWQSCVRFGLTWQYMALQTDFQTREDIYGYQTLSRPAIRNGYTDSTINDLLDGRVTQDQARNEGWQQAWSNGKELSINVLMIDQSKTDSISLSADGTYIASVPVVKVNQLTGEEYRGNGYIDFQFVDGQWLIAYVSPDVDF